MSNPDKIARLGAHLQLFAAKDSVLEPPTVKVVQEYLRDGGSPEDAVDALANGYEGTADMVNLVSDWVREAGGDPGELIDGVVRSLLNSSFQSRAADATYRALAMSDDPTPEFLDKVACSEKWGPIAQRVTARDQKSSLQFFFRQRATMADGDVKWAVSPEGTIASIRRAIETLSSKSVVSDADLRAFYDDMARSATYDELTFALSLRVLAEISLACSDLSMKSVLRRCAQEIRIAAKSKIVTLTKVPEHDALAFVTSLGALVEAHTSCEEVPKGTLDALWTVISATTGKASSTSSVALSRAVGHLTSVFGPMRFATSDVVDVEAQIPPDDATISKRAAYLSVLCHPEVMSSMWEKLFVQSSRSPNTSTGLKADVNTSVRTCLCMLLALASVHLTQASGSQGLCSQKDGGGGGGSLDAEGRRRVVAEMKQARKVEDILHESVVLCEDLYPGCWSRAFDSKPEGSSNSRRDALIACIELSVVVGRGIILWSREGLLMKPDSSKLRQTCVYYLELLEVVAERYPNLCQDVIEVFADAYGYQLWSKMDTQRILKHEERLRRFYGNALVSMLRLRQGTSVVTLYRRRFVEDDDIEMSYLRIFMTDVLEVMTEPYSDAFATALLELLGATRMVASFKNEKKATRADGGGVTRVKLLVKEFGAAVKRANPRVDAARVDSVVEAYNQL